MRHVVVVPLLLLLGKTVLAHEPSPYVQKPEDEVAVSNLEGASVISITSRTGIGAAGISGLPNLREPVYLRFRYAAGEGFRSLESLVLSSGRHGCEFSLSRGALKGGCCSLGPDARCLPDSRGVVDDQPWRHEDGFLEVLVPHALIEGDATALTVRWIDAYR